MLLSNMQTVLDIIIGRGVSGHFINACVRPIIFPNKLVMERSNTKNSIPFLFSSQISSIETNDVEFYILFLKLSISREIVQTHLSNAMLYSFLSGDVWKGRSCT